MANISKHPAQAHKYLRVRTKDGNFLFRCVLPGCQHYLRDDFIVGAIATCWRCEREFTMDAGSKFKKPHCRNCTRRRGLEDSPQPIEESPI